MRKTLLAMCCVVGATAPWHLLANDIGSGNTTYIVNGVNVSISQFPSFSSLYFDQLDTSGLYQNFCGATILDAFHVLTAAHCVQGDRYYSTYTSIAPQLQAEFQIFSGSVELIRASEFYYPSSFVNSASLSWPNDIAIIKLDSPMPVSSSDYVTLASASDIPSYDIPGTSMFVLGHGYTASGIDESEYLQGTTQTLLSSTSCRSANISTRQLCLQGAIDSSSLLRNSTCGGDSGGPLFWNRGGQYVQVGITSYGPFECGDTDADYASAYTEVAEYREWIADVLAGRETPKIVVTDFDRDNFVDTDEAVTETESSGGSGGTLAWSWLILLLGVGGLRRCWSR